MRQQIVSRQNVKFLQDVLVSLFHHKESKNGFTRQSQLLYSVSFSFEIKKNIT